MNDRPTAASVDEALEAARADLGLAPRRVVIEVLAAEVRTLRQELADRDLRIQDLLGWRNASEATIARVEALGSGPGYIMGDDTLIKLGDIRAALRGKP